MTEQNNYRDTSLDFDSIIRHLQRLKSDDDILKTRKITIVRSKKNRYKWNITESYDDSLLEETQ